MRCKQPDDARQAAVPASSGWARDGIICLTGGRHTSTGGEDSDWDSAYDKDSDRGNRLLRESSIWMLNIKKRDPRGLWQSPTTVDITSSPPARSPSLGVPWYLMMHLTQR